ncbi:MAG: hypothetical protein QFC78_08290 [Pseudomonadota bacterium]|nr:hypothetical protein [Pseudomonadota bacterium]
MTLDWANLVGLLGSVLFIAAFAYANAAEQFDKLLFNAANLLGAVLLLTSLWVHFNLPAFVLEVAWAAIALIGLVQATIARRKLNQP